MLDPVEEQAEPCSFADWIHLTAKSKYISLKWGKHTEHCFPRVSRTTLVAFDDKPSIHVPISRDIWQTVLYSQ